MFSNTMDLETLFAFAATFPEQFEEFMRDSAEHIELSCVHPDDRCLRVAFTGRYGPCIEYVPGWDSICLAE